MPDIAPPSAVSPQYQAVSDAVDAVVAEAVTAAPATMPQPAAAAAESAAARVLTSTEGARAQSGEPQYHQVARISVNAVRDAAALAPRRAAQAAPARPRRPASPPAAPRVRTPASEPAAAALERAAAAMPSEPAPAPTPPALQRPAAGGLPLDGGAAAALAAAQALACTPVASCEDGLGAAPAPASLRPPALARALRAAKAPGLAAVLGLRRRVLDPADRPARERRSPSSPATGAVASTPPLAGLPQGAPGVSAAPPERASPRGTHAGRAARAPARGGASRTRRERDAPSSPVAPGGPAAAPGSGAAASGGGAFAAWTAVLVGALALAVPPLRRRLRSGPGRRPTGPLATRLERPG